MDAEDATQLVGLASRPFQRTAYLPGRVFCSALDSRSVFSCSTSDPVGQKMIPEVFNEKEPEQTINPDEAVTCLQELSKGAPELAKGPAAQVSTSTPLIPHVIAASETNMMHQNQFRLRLRPIKRSSNGTQHAFCHVSAAVLLTMACWQAQLVLRPW